jgi:hypothetical protein
MLEKMTGYVQPVGNADTLQGHPQEPLTHCQARKVGGRICGAPLKEGINGHMSCSDMSCQVPATPHGLKRRGGNAKC